jgi:hypothetical protein
VDFRKLWRRTFIAGSVGVAAVVVASHLRIWQLWLGRGYLAGAPQVLSIGYDSRVPAVPPPAHPFVRFWTSPLPDWDIDYLQLPTIDTFGGPQLSIPWWLMAISWCLMAVTTWYIGRRGRKPRGFPVQPS